MKYFLQRWYQTIYQMYNLLDGYFWMTYIVFLNLPLWLYKLLLVLFLPPKLSILARKPYHVSQSMTKQTQWLFPDHPGHSLSLISLPQSAWRMHGSLASHWVQMPRLILVFAGCTCNFVGVVMHMLICLSDFSLSENRLYFNKGQELRMVNVTLT